MSNQPPYGYQQGSGYQGGYAPQSPPVYPSSGGTAKDFLTFRKMITPVIIQVIFWVGVAASIVGSIITIGMGLSTRGGEGAAFLGLVMLFVGPLIIRIYCELLILFFRMNETMTEIKKNLERRPY